MLEWKGFDHCIFYSLLKYYFPYFWRIWGRAVIIAHSKCLHPALPVPVVQAPPWDHIGLVIGGEWGESVGCLGLILTLLRCPSPSPSHNFSCFPETGCLGALSYRCSQPALALLQPGMMFFGSNNLLEMNAFLPFKVVAVGRLSERECALQSCHESAHGCDFEKKGV